MFAITAIKGVGRRFANIALKKVRKLVYNSVWAFVCILMHFIAVIKLWQEIELIKRRVCGWQIRKAYIHSVVADRDSQVLTLCSAVPKIFHILY